jgi:hypothetical protein
MNRTVSLSAIAATLLLATASAAYAQQSQDPRYVDVGRDFRQSDRVTMGSDLLTQEEQSRFATMRQQAKTTADKNRVAEQETALLNQRVSERINSALNQPIGTPTPNTAERPDSHPMPGSSTMPDSGMGSGSGSMGGMGSGTR